MQAEMFYRKLRVHYEEELPFVAYREPQLQRNLPVRALLQNNNFLYAALDFTESGFIFAPFDDGKEVLLIPDGNSERLILENPGDGLQIERLTPELENTAPQEREKHLGLIKKAVEVLEEGELDKVVLSRREEVKLGERDPLELFQELLRNYPSAFVYCWYHPKIGLWLGATPETLLQLEGLNFRTMALAATQKFEGSMEVNWGEKEKQEQQYVTDSILENLKAFEPSEGLEVSTPYTSRAGNLLHLRTDISGRLSSVDRLKEIVYSLHPTPAVCGLPKEKAKQFIMREEGYDREFYTGFLGELNMQEKRNRSSNRRNVENLAYAAVKRKTSLYVNLRCMKLEEGIANLFIGGGITKDSIPEDEWQETRNKAQTIKKVF